MAVRNRQTQQQYQSAYRGNSYYTYGSVAHELQPSYSPSPYEVEERERLEKQRKDQERRQKLERREARVISVKMIAVVFMLFAGCIAFMAMNVAVDKEALNIRQMRNQISNSKEVNAILAAELSEQIDMEYIKETATTRLSMSEPQPYQIVYIDVPKQSYTIQYAADEAQ